MHRTTGPARPVAILLLAALSLATPSAADTLRLEPSTISQWKSVFGRIEARDHALARTRIGGTLVEMTVTEGDRVTAGQQIALVHDDKLTFQIDAVASQLAALSAQLERAQSEYDRGKSLFDRGTTTSQALDQLATELQVTKDQISAAEAQRNVLQQQQLEGAVLAPADGTVLSVPVTKDSVVMPGEAVATIASNGFFLRIALPERYARYLSEGTNIPIQASGSTRVGTLAKVYPEITNGRVLADVDVVGLDTAFVGARALVQVPVGTREALLVPTVAVTTRSGVDFVTVETAQGEADRAVILGEDIARDGIAMVEVLTGLVAGDEVVLP